MGGIFISYRREDSAGHAGRLFDALTDQFDPAQIFMDVDSIGPGDEFPHVIEQRIASCDVLLAVIGPRWGSAADGLGKRRIENSDDYVRRELEAALEQKVQVIPVLVGGASMPGSESLPESLVPLARRQAYVLNDHGFHEDLRQLIAALLRAIARSRQEKREAAAQARLEQRRTARLNPNRPGVRSELARNLRWWLLLYTPAHKATWILHGLFYALLFLFLFAAPIAYFDEAANDRLNLVLGMAGGFLMFLVPIRALAFIVEPEAKRAGRFRRLLLLYRPGRASTAFVHVAFVFLAMITILAGFALAGMLVEAQSGHTRLMLIDAFLLIAMLALIVREIAAARDPLRPLGTPRSHLTEFFYLWKPRRGAVWIPRLAFFASALSLFIVAPLPFLDSNGNFSIHELADNRGDIVVDLLFLAVAFSARKWVVACSARPLRLENPGAFSRLRNLMLLSARAWRANWPAAALFYAGVAFAVLFALPKRRFISLIGLEEGSRVLLAGTGILLAACARGWATLGAGERLSGKSRATSGPI